MSKNKSSFVGYSQKEVNAMESEFFCLVMAGDFISQDNFYLFTDKEVSKIYKDTFNKLIDIINDGSEKSSKHALTLIGTLSVQPFRLH